MIVRAVKENRLRDMNVTREEMAQHFFRSIQAGSILRGRTVRGPYNIRVILSARGRHAACLRKRHAGSFRGFCSAGAPSAVLAAYSSVIRTKLIESKIQNQLRKRKR